MLEDNTDKCADDDTRREQNVVPPRAILFALADEADKIFSSREGNPLKSFLSFFVIPFLVR